MHKAKIEIQQKMATNFFVCMYVYIHRFVHCSISIYNISPIFRSVHTTAFLYVVDFGKHINHYFWLVALRYKGIILLSCLTRSLITHFLHSRYSIVFCNEMLLSMLYMFWPIKSLYLIWKKNKNQTSRTLTKNERYIVLCSQF